MEELLKNVSEFARKNLEAFDSAIQWFLKISKNGTWPDIWNSAKYSLDWKKILFLSWLGSDEEIYKFITIEGFDIQKWCKCNKSGDSSQLNFQCDFIYGMDRWVGGGKSPNYYLIQNALEEGKKAVAGGKMAVQKKGKEVLSIVAFMEKYCDCDKGTDIKSRRDALLEANQKHTIKLPKTANNAGQGQTYRYYSKDLIACWAVCSKKVNLPPLKT